MKTTLLVSAVALIVSTFTASAVGTPAAAPVVRETYQGKTAFEWHRIAVTRRVERDRSRHLAGDAIRYNRHLVRTLRTQRRVMLHRADSREALRLAAITYHVSYDFLYRLASCESTGGDGLNPNAKNRSSTAAGLGQFLDGTWAATIYGHESVYSPYANALAMGKEVADGHAGWQWAASRSCWS